MYRQQFLAGKAWSRRVGVVLLLLAMAGVALWWSRQALMQWGLQQILARTSLASPTFSGFHVGLDHADVKSMEFGVDTGSGPLAVQLEGVSANYDLSVPKVEAISAAHAHLKFAYRPQDNADSESRELQFPLPRFNVEHLALEVETPWGLCRFAGRTEIGSGEANTLVATFQDDKQTIRFEFDAALRIAKATIELRSGGKIFELTTDSLDQSGQHAALDANAGSLVDWLSTNELLPEAWRAKLAGSDSPQRMPGVASMHLLLTADTQDRFDSLQGRLMLTRNQGYLGSADIKMAPQYSRVDVDGHLDMAATEAAELIKPWLTETASNWQISAGGVQGTFKLRWQPNRNSAGTAHFRAHDVDLTAGSVKLAGTNLELDVADISRRSMALAMDIPKLTLGKETKLGNLNVKAQLLDSDLTLEKATVPMFGGILEVLPDKVNIDQRPIRLTLGVQNVDLSQLLDSLDYPALSGTGSISGKLPLRLTAEAIELDEGTLKGTRPGVLKYQGAVGDDENPAFKALRNLVYHSLQADVNYRPNGDYHLGLRLEGSNPEVFSGHPLAFNLNLSGQLPELLRKGIQAGDFERSILEQAAAKPVNIPKVAKPGTKPPTGEH